MHPDPNNKISYSRFFKYEIANYSLKSNKFTLKNITFRPIENANSPKRPIIIFGCSYAYGYNFDNKETISHIMAQFSTRPIINRACCGWGIQHMIYQLKNVDFTKFAQLLGAGEYKPPKYVFFVLMEEYCHFQRLKYTCFTAPNNDYYLSYIVKNGKLVQREPFGKIYLKSNFLTYFYNNYYIKNKVLKDFNNKNIELFDLFILHFKIANELIKEKFGKDTKLIILTFEDTKKELWQKELEKNGIDVIDIAETLNTKNLKDENLEFFYPPQCPHPTGKLWKTLLPKLKEKYPDL